MTGENQLALGKSSAVPPSGENIPVSPTSLTSQPLYSVQYTSQRSYSRSPVAHTSQSRPFLGFGLDPCLYHPSLSTVVNRLRWQQWRLLHQLHLWTSARSMKVMPTEKQLRWENMTKCCAEAVSTSILLHKGHSPAMLHLTGPAFYLHGDQWQSFGSDKLAPPSHTTHVGTILVRLCFLSPRQQLDDFGALTCKSRKLSVYYAPFKDGKSALSFQQALCGNFGQCFTYSLHYQPSNAHFLDT